MIPKVSVIMPVHNGVRFLHHAIQSILSQDYEDFEFVILDDGSTDGTPDILRSLKDSRVVLLRNEKNEGIVNALNHCIERSRGMFIARMDADDESEAVRLGVQISYLRDRPLVAAVGSQVVLIDEAGSRIGSESFPQDPAAIRSRMFIHNPFAHGSVMLRAEVLKQLGAYDPRFLHNEDYDLWLRIGARHDLANTETALLRRRIHGTNITIRKETELVRFRIKTLSHAIRSYYKNPLLIPYLLRPMAAYAFRKVREMIVE